MTPKQARFVAEYLVDLNATKAAERAGYSPKAAQETGSRLLSNPMIRAEMEQRQAKQLERVGITAEDVKRRMAQRAMMDPRKFWHPDGRLKAIHELDDDAAACLQGFEVVIKNTAAGDGVVDTVHKIKLADADKSLEMLAKHFGLLVERVEHSGEIAMRWQDEGTPE